MSRRTNREFPILVGSTVILMYCDETSISLPNCKSVVEDNHNFTFIIKEGENIKISKNDLEFIKITAIDGGWRWIIF